MLLLLGPLCLIEGRKVAQLFLPLLVLVLGHGLDSFSSGALPSHANPAAKNAATWNYATATASSNPSSSSSKVAWKVTALPRTTCCATAQRKQARGRGRKTAGDENAAGDHCCGPSKEAARC